MVPQDDKDYAAKVIAKQEKKTPDKALARLHDFNDEALAQLVAAGRAGNLPEVHALLAAPHHKKSK